MSVYFYFDPKFDKDSIIEYDGKIYNFKKHGFIRSIFIDELGRDYLIPNNSLINNEMAIIKR